jgi:uncharacterized protein (DUF302 family)
MIKKIMFPEPRHTISMLVTAGLMVFLVICMLPGLAVAQDAAGDPPQPVHVVQSQKSFPATLKAFKEEVTRAGWSLLNVNNLAGVLSERGFTLHPVVILDLCSSKYSVRILSNDDYRPFSVFMPCRVSIYQLSDGKVFISRMNTGALASMMRPEVVEVMSASDGEIAKIIARTVR